MNKTIISTLCFVTLILTNASSYCRNSDLPQEIQIIDSVWAANTVSFSLFEHSNKQLFAAYYNKDRYMTIASKRPGQNQWETIVLDEKLHWDSHNYVTLAVDKKGYIHVTGNMHVNPLVYYRSAKPLDIKSMQRLDSMVGSDELNVTYPKFIFNKEEDLLFLYRDGTCGNGNTRVNIFNTETLAWERPFKEPLFQGIIDTTDRAAYFKIKKDETGNFHLIWLWRWTPLVETCHQLCYAYSEDFKNWTNISGEKIELAFTPDNTKLIVDPAPTKGGMHNGKFDVVFTKKGEPIPLYIKYDEKGMTQLYAAKYHNNKWDIKQISNWNFRWEFIGGGDKMDKGASFNQGGYNQDSLLLIYWQTQENKNGIFALDLEAFEKVETFSVNPNRQKTSLNFDKLLTNPDTEVRITKTTNSGNVPPPEHYLKWEAMPKSHGRHAPETIPDGPISPLLIISPN